MQNIVRFLMIAACSFLLFTQSHVANSAEFKWQAILAGEFMDDALSEARIVSLRGKVRMNHTFQAPLSVFIDAGVLLETGSTQTLFTDEFVPETTLFLQEARLNWRPFTFFEFRLGALDQNHHGSQLFINDVAFPGLMQIVHWKYNRWKFQINSQQAVATSTSFSTRAIGKEDTPYLLSGAVKVGYSDGDSYAFNARGTYYQFKNLTRGIAHDSRFYGNTVVGIGPEGARFFHQYQGFETGINASYIVHKHWHLVAGNSFIHNQKGPSGGNRGTYYFGGFSYIDPKIRITPRFGVFNIQSDSAVAYYSSRRFGHNNRKGHVFGLEVKLPNDHIAIEGQYVNAELINASPIQADRTFYELRIVTDYLSF